MLEQQQQKQLWVIIIIVFLGFIGISMPYLIFPSLFLNPSYSILPPDWENAHRAIILGITLAAYPLGQFIGSPILGALSDEHGRKRILASSLFVASICYLIAGLAIQWHHISLLILSRFLAGLMEGNIAIARAMAADLTTISKHTTFGKINAATSIAFFIGPFLGGLLSDKTISEHLTASTPFYFICFLFFCLAIATEIVLKRRLALIPAITRGFWQRINLIKRMKALFQNKHLQFLLIISTCFTLAVDIFYEFGPVYLTLKWSLDPVQLVYYNTALCIALAVGNGWLPAVLTSRYANLSIIVSSLGGFALFLLGIVLTNSSEVMLILFILSGIAIGLGVTLLTVNISDSVSDAIQGEVMGVQVSLRVLGDAIICLFGGILLSISPKLILIIAAILSLLAMTYYTAKQFSNYMP